MKLKPVKIGNHLLTSPKGLGSYGERLANSLLPNSYNLNYPKDLGCPYDLLWNGIAIDVKFTTVTHGLANNKAKYSFRWSKEHFGIVLLHIAVIKDQEYYWVQPYDLKCKYIFYLHESLTKAEIPSAIIRAKQALLSPTNVEDQINT